MNEILVNEFAGNLFEAQKNRKEILRFTSKHPNFDLARAYEVQWELLKLTQDRVCGYKMGLTSKAKMVQMGVNCPISGFLTEKMLVSNETPAFFHSLIHPKIEPEVAIVLGQDICGPLNLKQAQEVSEFVCAALEIIDSRYLNFDFKLPDVVADNCSASFFCLGPKKRLRDLGDLRNLGMVLEIDELPVQFASSSAVLGNPIESIVSLSRLMDSLKIQKIPKGSVVLTGGATAAVEVKLGSRIKAKVQLLEDAVVEMR